MIQLELDLGPPAWPARQDLPGWTRAWTPAPCPDCGGLACCDKCLAGIAALAAA